MPNNTSFIPLTADKVQELSKFGPCAMSEPWFRVIPQEQIPGVFPEQFRVKLDHAVIMASGDASGRVYLVLNAQRVYTKAHAIDQEPFGVVFDNGVPSQSGVFVHHGDWQGRTQSIAPPHFWSHVAASGIGNYYPPPSLAADSSGPLSALGQSSNIKAFNQTLQAMLGYL